ncbi:MAG: 50S ribosomal protein L30e [Candidatus Thermoplasmatota archaeon]|jgi:large subunit ribosomal protein L30e|nr:50S ribosomal protein L30e [Candidatus Thermoplasmatota archaeon]MCL5963387.1 50S ribosomal protein L30e [Candidatus Thermoplasmatota archaeon]
MDIAKALKVAIESGKVRFGVKETEKYVNKKEVKLIVVSTTCPEMESVMNYKVPLYKFEGNGHELGIACGKPFNVSIVSIIDPGNSGILALGE